MRLSYALVHSST